MLCVRVSQPALWTESVGGGRLHIVQTELAGEGLAGGKALAFESGPAGPRPGTPGGEIRRSRLGETAALDSGGILGFELLGLQGAADVLLCCWSGPFDPEGDACFVHMMGCFEGERFDRQAAPALGLPLAPSGPAGG